MQLTEGNKFHDRYTLQKLLGRGGFSEVWLAQDDRTNVLVAVKIYAPGQGLDQAGITIFSQEFSLVFDMNHTNLLHPTHFDVWEGMPYLILPYCKNGSAFQYISNGQTMPEDECWKLLHDTAAGLAYLHEKQPPIIHQDIKPDNILINDEGNYMITDFGISARVRHTMHQANAKEQSSGTMAYMGPERFSANPKPIMASDIWSLGAMLYELMTNDAPFGNFGGGMQKNGAEIPEIKQDYSQALKNIVCKCLEKETWDRPTAREIEEMTYNVIHGITGTEELAQTMGTQPAQPIVEQPAQQPVQQPQQPVQQPVAEQPVQPVHAPKPPKKQNPKQEKTETPKQEQPATPQPQNNGNDWNPKMSEPLKKESFLSSTMGKAVIGGVAVAIIAGACFMFAGGGESVEEAPVIVENTDSINAVEFATTCMNEADVLMDSISVKWTTEDDLQNATIDDDLVQAYSKYAEGLNRVAQYSNSPIYAEIEDKQGTAKSKLDELKSQLNGKAAAMEALEQTEIAEMLRTRIQKVDETLSK